MTTLPPEFTDADIKKAQDVVSSMKLFQDGLEAQFGKEWIENHVALAIAASVRDIAKEDDDKAGLAVAIVGSNAVMELMVATMAMKLGKAYEKEMGLEEGTGAAMFIGNVVGLVESYLASGAEVHGSAYKRIK